MGFALLALIATSTWAQNAPVRQLFGRVTPQGVIVEEVRSGSQTSSAGIQPGDSISGWFSGSTVTPIESPFDWADLQIEKEPLNAITVHGFRGNEAREWMLKGQPWGLVVGPRLRDGLRIRYQECLTRARNVENTDCWRQVLGLIDEYDPPWLAPWVLKHIGEISAGRGSPKEADEAFEEAVRRSQIAGERALARVLHAWGIAAENRGDLAAAEQHYRRAMAIRDGLAPDSLAATESRYRAGCAAQRQGKLAEAERDLRQALAIQQKFAPETVDLATTLTCLGAVADYRGDVAGAYQYFSQALAIQQKVNPDSLTVAMLLDNLSSEVANSGDLLKAEEYLQQALTIQQKWPTFGLELARSLEGIGEINYRRGDLAKAEEYARRASSLRERLAPDSLVVAGSFNLLGIIAWGRGDLSKAEESFRKDLAIHEKLSSHDINFAVGLDNLGGVLTDRGELAEAETCLGQALSIRETLAPGSLDVAGSFHHLGSLALRRGDIKKAEEYFQKALAIRQKLAPDSLDVSVTLASLGAAIHQGGDDATAEKYLMRASAIQRKVAPSSPAAASTLGFLGDIAAARGDLTSAEQHYEQALSIEEKASPNSLIVASRLQQLGRMSVNRSDLIAAEGFYARALIIYQELAPKTAEAADPLFWLGFASAIRGDLLKAEEYFNDAFAIASASAPGDPKIAGYKIIASAVLDSLRGNVAGAGERFSSLAVYKNISSRSEGFESAMLWLRGIAALNRGDLAEAEDDYRKSLALEEKVAPGGLTVAERYDGLGSVFRAKGDLGKAGEYFQLALTIEQKLAPGTFTVASTLTNFAHLAWDRNELAQAEVHYQDALTIFEKLMPGSLAEADVLRSLGLIERQRGRTDEVEVYFRRALDAIERQTIRLGGSEEARASFRAERQEYYQDYLDTLLALKQPEQAFHVLERGRARSLLAMLAERDLVFGGDLPAEIDRARMLNASSYDRTYAQLSKLNPQKDGAEIEKLLANLRDLNTEREQIAEQVRRSSPRLSILQYPQPLDVAATRQVLDAGTALLSYSVSKEKIVLFVVRPAQETPGLSVFTIPVDEKKLRTQIDGFRKLILDRRGLTDSAFVSQARQLYDLLIKPAESAIATSERIVMVPDGALNALPFPALLRTRSQYLVEWKPLHTVVSATVYAELMKGRRQEAKPIELVAFGDPRYAGDNKNQGERSADAELSVATERGLTLSPLLFSKAEVDGITSLYPGRSRKYEGADATEERAKSVGTNVRYIHFAVHGILDDRFPLNSALALTIPEKVVEGQDNGLLQAWEIFERVRIDADLVTLSACNTGLGQELNGEGLIGLTRAFQYAGAHSILASLWAVDDLRTMQLMKQVYGGLRAGKTKDQALREAQLSLLHSQPASSPYYWAAFSLSGDWR